MINARLQEVFVDLRDPRVERGQKHPFMSIIGLGIIGALAGIDNFFDLQIFAEEKKEELDDLLDFPNGIPSHDTIGRVFSMINSRVFADLFMVFTASLAKKDRKFVAFDGKAIRNCGQPLNIVSAWCSQNKMSLGQVRVGNKSNEIVAIPLLLEMLDLDGCIVTIDAIGCQKKIAHEIVGKNCDYVLALKENNKSLYRDVVDYFSSIEQFEHSSWEEWDKGHGRIEHRICWATSDIEWLKREHSWAKLTSVAKIVSTRTIKGKTSTDTRFYISSLLPDAELLCRAARSHWGVENQLHWVLDVVFNEDKSCIRSDHAPENMSILRRFAINIHNTVKPEKLSMRASMKKCSFSTKYLKELISAI